MDLKFDSLEKSIEKADEVLAKWQNNANEWRSTVTDISASKLGRDEALVRFSTIEDRIDRVSRAVENLQGKIYGLAAAVTLVGIGFGVWGNIHH